MPLVSFDRWIDLPRTPDLSMISATFDHRLLSDCITMPGNAAIAEVVIFSISSSAQVINQLAWISTPASKNQPIFLAISLPVV